MRAGAGWVATAGVVLGLGALLRQQLMAPRTVIAGPSPAILLSPAPSEPVPQAPAPPPPAPKPRMPTGPPTLHGTGLAEVHVVSAQDQRPLAGVMVAIIRKTLDLAQPLESATTDARGVALFPTAGPGRFYLCARGAGHGESCSLDLGLVAGGTITATLSLPPGAVVTGTVLQHDGTPAQGVRLMASSHRAMPTQAITDAQGHYVLDGVSPGSNEIHPFTSEGRGATRTVDVRQGEEARLDIQLAGFTHVTVQPLRDRHRRGARIKKSRDKDLMDFVVVSLPLRRQENGTWTGTVEAGSRTASVSGLNGRTSLYGEVEVELSPGVPAFIKVPYDTDEEDIIVEPPRREEREPFEVAGHVFLPDGTPAPGARIALVRPSRYWQWCGNGPVDYDHIRFEGSAFVVNLPEGTGTIQAWLEDGRAGEVTVTGTKGQRVVADIHLEETGAVVGRIDVTSKGGQGEGMPFTIDKRIYHPLSIREPDGHFIVAGLTPGEHVLRMDGHYGQHRFVIKPGALTDLGLLNELVLTQPP
ncbi:carboxypeptidase regulatory-like domain-containing protein [Myxococcus eversor]|uniref:carboxypeptidase regulatory-like domain-containing protein n=1 Tax=Myxococcus eversor TaxID=2709661 RepID=UPI0013D3E16D|nr:carboxypeptidase regulatory-like domain-containing protein [Myxococcus eversor]